MKESTLLIATRNRGKVREYQELLAEVPARLISLDEAGIDFEVEETGRSFRDNAVLKAKAYAHASGLCTLADDSGLEVDALGGEPGVLSSRYAGPGATDEDRNRFLLAKLANVPADHRSARFRCVIAVAAPDGEVKTAEGACEGRITFAPSGPHGFGYDPVFFLPELGKTMAELPPSEKNRLSHRARACRNALPLVLELIRTGRCHS